MGRIRGPHNGICLFPTGVHRLIEAILKKFDFSPFPRHLYLCPILCKMRLLILISLLAIIFTIKGQECPGSPPLEDFKCKDGIWQTSSSLVVQPNQTLMLNTPCQVNGNLTFMQGSMVHFTPSTVKNSEAWLKVINCLIFINSSATVTLMPGFVTEMVYAHHQKNGWVYLLMMESGCSPEVEQLAVNYDIFWEYGISVNATLISSKRSKITYFPLPEGRFGIQVGLQGGSPIGSLAWFWFGIALLVVFLILVIVLKIFTCATEQKIEQGIQQIQSINTDDQDVQQIPLVSANGDD